MRIAQDADVFLCEASYLDGADNPPGLHLTGREAGEVATKAGAKRLLLTHLVAAWGSESHTQWHASEAFPQRAGRNRPPRGAVRHLSPGE
jgi:ribonuclease BN (tRNA processing enzyme)